MSQNQTSQAGRVLKPGTVVILSLDGTLVYVESMEQTFAGVVALPEQPNEVPKRVFTPGRVGLKRISPFSTFDREIESTDLSEVNQEFLRTYEQVRTDHGPNKIHLAKELPKADFSADAPKAKREKKAKEPKAGKPTPRYMRRCSTCNEQPGHPNHSPTDPSSHEFVDPAPDAQPEPKPERVKKPKAEKLCVACDEPESDAAHSKPKAEGGHKFVPGRRTAAAAASPHSAPSSAKPARTSSTKAATSSGPVRWTGTDAAIEVLAGANAKFKAGNSGAAIIDALKAAGSTGLDVAGIHDALATSSNPRWGGISDDRLAKAVQQLTDAKLVEVVA